MSELVRFALEDDSSVLVEVEQDESGFDRVARGSDGVLEASHQLTQALGGVRAAAQQSLEALQGLSPEAIELEFGIKLSGEAGAVIAKTSAEGHFTVKLAWKRRAATER
jgi:hypothetical protein